MITRPPAPWNEDEWVRLDRQTARRALARGTEEGAREEIRRYGRRILSAYSTSFFMVTRFLPAAKRAQVEVTYAAVRYPDEIVDTFQLTPWLRLRRLALWADRFEQALATSSVREALEAGLPPILAGWASVVRGTAIPPRDYHAFLTAMRRDACPRPFATLDDLIDSYVYGSAVVVGYFLAHVYGPGAGRDLAEARGAARDLGIALQLTNFLRDIREDARRGRVYLPQDHLRRAGIVRMDVEDPAQHPAITRVVHELAGCAETLYASSRARLDVFAADSRVAIRACIDVYRQLNARIARTADTLLERQRVPFLDKYRVLPASKYWRLPLAYLAS
jgi:15-cis-phytoene synthase